eukprot:CAMPEP_0194361446 /NCGR_PEP_ID=MMETSP0174-20130528/9040_1 /TAXON_ID=216777 /ORGANISM="Proboscia alata, Strain PI-D3" /LENGTH=1605 /DNA_ID=CAMNT_0039133669 /DNA_START=246 /DNA_END=5063 /DNA_ORIENTATION=+
MDPHENHSGNPSMDSNRLFDELPQMEVWNDVSSASRLEERPFGRRIATFNSTTTTRSKFQFNTIDYEERTREELDTVLLISLVGVTLVVLALVLPLAAYISNKRRLITMQRRRYQRAWALQDEERRHAEEEGEEEEELYRDEVTPAIVVNYPEEPKREVRSTELGVEYPTNDIPNIGDVPPPPEGFFLPLCGGMDIDCGSKSSVDQDHMAHHYNNPNHVDSGLVSPDMELGQFQEEIRNDDGFLDPEASTTRSHHSVSSCSFPYEAARMLIAEQQIALHRNTTPSSSQRRLSSTLPESPRPSGRSRSVHSNRSGSGQPRGTLPPTLCVPTTHRKEHDDSSPSKATESTRSSSQSRSSGSVRTEDVNVRKAPTIGSVEGEGYVAKPTNRRFGSSKANKHLAIPLEDEEEGYESGPSLDESLKERAQVILGVMNNGASKSANTTSSVWKRNQRIHEQMVSNSDSVSTGSQGLVESNDKQQHTSTYTEQGCDVIPCTSLLPPDTLLSAILVDLDQLYKGWVDKRGVRQHITNLGGQCLGDLEGLDLATGELERRNDLRGRNWLVKEETLHLPNSSRRTHRGTVSSAPVLSSHGVERAGSTPTPAPSPAHNWDGVPFQKGSSSHSSGCDYSVSPQLPSPSRLTLQDSYTSRNSPQRNDNDSQARPHIISPDSVPDPKCRHPESIRGYGDGAYDSQPEPFTKDTHPGLDLEDPLPRAIWNQRNVNVPPPVRAPTTKEDNPLPTTDVYPASQLTFRRMLCHVTPHVLQSMFQSLLSLSLPVLILLYRPLVEFLVYGIVQSLFQVPLSIPRGVTNRVLQLVQRKHTCPRWAGESLRNTMIHGFVSSVLICCMGFALLHYRSNSGLVHSLDYLWDFDARKVQSLAVSYVSAYSISVICCATFGGMNQLYDPLHALLHGIGRVCVTLILLVLLRNDHHCSIVGWAYGIGIWDWLFHTGSLTLSICLRSFGTEFRNGLMTRSLRKDSVPNTPYSYQHHANPTYRSMYTRQALMQSALEIGQVILDESGLLFMLLSIYILPRYPGILNPLVPSWILLSCLWKSQVTMSNKLGTSLAELVRRRNLCSDGTERTYTRALTIRSGQCQMVVGLFVSVVPILVLLQTDTIWNPDHGNPITRKMMHQAIRNILPFFVVGSIPLSVTSTCAAVYTQLQLQKRRSTAVHNHFPKPNPHMEEDWFTTHFVRVVPLASGWILVLPFSIISTFALRMEIEGLVMGICLGYIVTGFALAYHLLVFREGLRGGTRQGDACGTEDLDTMFPVQTIDYERDVDLVSCLDGRESEYGDTRSFAGDSVEQRSPKNASAAAMEQYYLNLQKHNNELSVQKQQLSTISESKYPHLTIPSSPCRVSFSEDVEDPNPPQRNSYPFENATRTTPQPGYTVTEVSKPRQPALPETKRPLNEQDCAPSQQQQVFRSRSSGVPPPPPRPYLVPHIISPPRTTRHTRTATSLPPLSPTKQSTKRSASQPPTYTNQTQHTSVNQAPQPHTQPRHLQHLPNTINAYPIPMYESEPCMSSVTNTVEPHTDTEDERTLNSYRLAALPRDFGQGMRGLTPQVPPSPGRSVRFADSVSGSGKDEVWGEDTEKGLHPPETGIVPWWSS